MLDSVMSWEQGALPGPTCAAVSGRPTPGARSALRMRSCRHTAMMRSLGKASALQKARPYTAACKIAARSASRWRM